jgi:NAD+ synthase
VVGLLMPEKESSPDSLDLGRLVGQRLGIQTVVEDITEPLRALGCYARRDAAIRTVIPEYQDGDRSKIVLEGTLQGRGYNLCTVVVEAADGTQRRSRLTAEAYLAVVAATSFKQRVRKMVEYHHADRLRYAVAGTPNRLEHDQGFFVKNGDGAADLKPIAHLYKTQVYELAAYLEVPEDVRRRTPTTDTYPLEQSQEEFYFSLPYHQFDLCLYGLNHDLPVEDVARLANLPESRVALAYREIARRRKATRYLGTSPLLVEPFGLS